MWSIICAEKEMVGNMNRDKANKTDRTAKQTDDIPEESRQIRVRIILLTVLCYLVFVAALTVLVDGRHPHFYVSEGLELRTAYGQVFDDPGVYAVLSGRIFGNGQKLLPIAVEGEVDSNCLGRYSLTYSTRYMLRTYSVTRTVEVVDRTAPVITLFSREGYRASWLAGYEEEGYTAEDNVDGDLTAAVRIENRGDEIVYTVSDRAGNTAEAVRVPDYTIGVPVLILNGDEEMHEYAGFSFEDPGCIARDSQGNNLTEHIRVSGSVIPYETGNYELMYSITNSRGETVSTTRRVVIEPLQNPDTFYPDEPTIYLTFDDGPGPYTDRLLDVLKKYNVKATFFVTKANPEYFDCIGRAFREGHSIGIHSASHVYKSIYASEDAFFRDFNEVQDLIYEQTGTYSNICRFPGGSSNTVSSFNKGIMTRLAKDLTDLGFQYFDWDVASGDAGETTKTDTVYANVVEGISGRKTTVVLQHDIKDFSVAAVEKIINWGLRNGYVFQPLDISSPPAHHIIDN